MTIYHNVQSEIMRHVNKQENLTTSQEEKQARKTNPEMTQSLELAEKDFKAPIIIIYLII